MRLRHKIWTLMISVRLYNNMNDYYSPPFVYDEDI